MDRGTVYLVRMEVAFSNQEPSVNTKYRRTYNLYLTYLSMKPACDEFYKLEYHGEEQLSQLLNAYQHSMDTYVLLDARPFVRDSASKTLVKYSQVNLSAEWLPGVPTCLKSGNNYSVYCDTCAVSACCRPCHEEVCPRPGGPLHCKCRVCGAEFADEGLNVCPCCGRQLRFTLEGGLGRFIPFVEQVTSGLVRECGICLGESAGMVVLGCTHTFHQACLQCWMLQAPRCPICNKPIALAHQRVRFRSKSHSAVITHWTQLVANYLRDMDAPSGSVALPTSQLTITAYEAYITQRGVNEQSVAVQSLMPVPASGMDWLRILLKRVPLNTKLQLFGQILQRAGSCAAVDYLTLDMLDILVLQTLNGGGDYAQYRRLLFDTQYAKVMRRRAATAPASPARVGSCGAPAVAAAPTCSNRPVHGCCSTVAACRSCPLSSRASPHRFRHVQSGTSAPGTDSS